MEHPPPRTLLGNILVFDPFLFRVQPKRFSQSHITTQDVSQSKVGQGGLTDGLAVRHTTYTWRKLTLVTGAFNQEARVKEVLWWQVGHRIGLSCRNL